MPSSGELKLRTLILALVALGGVWIGVFIQRSHTAPPTAVVFAAGPQPADVPAPKVVRVPGLSRPATVRPMPSATPRVRPFTRVPTRQTPDLRMHSHPAAQRPASKPGPPKTEPVPEDNRSAAESPP